MQVVKLLFRSHQYDASQSLSYYRSQTVVKHTAHDVFQVGTGNMLIEQEIRDILLIWLQAQLSHSAGLGIKNLKHQGQVTLR